MILFCMRLKKKTKNKRKKQRLGQLNNQLSCLLVEDYLHGKTQRVKVRNTFSDWQEVRRGVTQGSVLGAMFLFIVFFRNDIFIQIKTVQLHMYADDGQLHTSDTEPVSLEGRISREVNSVNAWYEISGIIYI